MLSVCITMLVVKLVLPGLSSVLSRDLVFDPLHEVRWLLIAIAVGGSTALLAGVIPAFYLSRMAPVTVLKGQSAATYRSPLRTALVVLQFAMAISLSIASATVYRQLSFMQHYDLGFRKDAVIVVPVSFTDRENEEILIQQLRNLPGVSDVTGSLRRLGNTVDLNAVDFSDNSGKHPLRVATMYVDYNYVPFYGIALLAGRNLSVDFGMDRAGRSYIVNETFAKQLLNYGGQVNHDYSSLLGQPLQYSYEDSAGTIVGVVRDFNFGSLHKRVEPLSLSYQPEYYFSDLSVRLHEGAGDATLTSIGDIWKKYLPGQSFAYMFLDNHLQSLYSSDRQAGRFVGMFTILAFLISGIGLVGMATFTIRTRTREIGIRKVLGASAVGIVALLSGDLLRWMLISALIAIPVAGWAATEWLARFAYHIPVTVWLLSLPALAGMMVALLTISLQAARAALANPVESLRTE